MCVHVVYYTHESVCSNLRVHLQLRPQYPAPAALVQIDEEKKREKTERRRHCEREGEKKQSATQGALLRERVKKWLCRWNVSLKDDTFVREKVCVDVYVCVFRGEYGVALISRID